MKAKKQKIKFYRPGTLEVPGTMISLKTQPYTNGVIFNIDDPITSFRAYLSKINYLIRQYEIFTSVSGIESVLGNDTLLKPEEIAKLKLLVNYLVESPIEISLKEQKVDQNVLTDLEVNSGC